MQAEQSELNSSKESSVLVKAIIASEQPKLTVFLVLYILFFIATVALVLLQSLDRCQVVVVAVCLCSYSQQINCACQFALFLLAVVVIVMVVCN